MKKLIALIALFAIFYSQLSAANTLILPSFFEPDLMGILDDEFGLASLQRIDDDMDQYWTVTRRSFGDGCRKTRWLFSKLWFT